MENIVSVQNLSHRFGLNWALRDLTFSAAAGCGVAVLGPNASGKTTLLKILATRLQPTSGEVILLGHRLKNGPSPIRQQLEWLGPEPALYRNLNAKENLEFYFKLKGERPEQKKISVALERVGLNGEAEKPVAAFSSGQKKRLALARILLGGAKIILLDEPHNHLDSSGRGFLNTLIAEWKKEGKAILLASHNPEETATLCEQTIRL